MSHYITCHNCGEPECMDSDTGVHRRDDGTVCPDPRDAEVEGLRAEVANAKRRAEDAEAKIARQAEELTTKDATLRQRTIDLDAMAWVWCDGGCKSGVFRYPENAELRPLTREMVARALRNVERMAGKLANLEVKEESERPAIWAAHAARSVADARARQAEAEVARLRAAAIPEDAEEIVFKELSIGVFEPQDLEIQEAIHAKRRAKASAVVKALRGQT